jgi:hypothetical protein
VTLAKETCELCSNSPVAVESIVQEEVCHEFVGAGCDDGKWCSVAYAANARLVPQGVLLA